jgi:hypothetical protein
VIGERQSDVDPQARDYVGQVRDRQSNRSNITKAANSPDRPIATRLANGQGAAQLIFKMLQHVYNPFWFSIFVSEERASEKSKAKYRHPSSARRRRAQA